MMTKSDTIDAITKLNPTANPGFLSGFSGSELSQYLGRLESVTRRGNRCDPTKPAASLIGARSDVTMPGHTS